MTTQQTNKRIGNKELEISDELKKLASEVITKEKIDLAGANVQYMLVFPNISKKTVGRCIRANKELTFFSDAEYIIQMSGEVWNQIGDDVKYILMYHELRHILPVTTKKGDIDYRIADHDVKDHYVIIKKYGIDWLSNLKTQVSSIYDLEPGEVDGISI